MKSVGPGEGVASPCPSGPEARVAARERLRGLAAFGAAGLALSAAGVAGYGLPCPWRVLTGTLCPLCGATHLGMRLLAADVPGAFAANPFVFLILAGVTAVTAWTLAELAGASPPPRTPALLRGDRLWAVLGILGLLFAVARNLPGTPL